MGKIVVKSSSRKEKKKIVFKNLKQKKLRTYLTGRIHGKQGLIEDSEGLQMSLWIKEKIKQFEENSADVWGFTAMNLIIDHKKMEEKKLLIAQLNDKLCELLKQENYSGENVIKLRREDKKAKKIKELKEKINQEKQDLSDIEVEINYSELETQEILCEGKRRVEKIVSTYLKGASKHTSVTKLPAIDFDLLSVFVYQERKIIELKGEELC